MSLSLALDAALSGLSAAQRQTQLASRNIANANTPGYVRKDAELESFVVAGEGRGVLVAGVVRHVDDALARDARREAGLASELETEAAGLASLTTILGDPNDERNVASAISRLETSFQRLAESPENPVLQRTVVSEAQEVVRSFDALSQEIQRQRQTADTAIANGVATVNESLDQLAKISQEIAVAGTAGTDVSDLRDQRDVLLDRIAQEMGINYFTQGNGEMMVMTEGGVTLLDGGTVHHLSFTQTPQIPPSFDYEPGMPGLSGITVDGVDIAPGSGTTGSIRSGRIAGLFTLRDQLMPQAQAQIDELASVIADSFQSQDATVGAGMTGLFTDGGARHDRGDPAAIVGLAGRLAVNDLVVPEAGGDLWRVRTGLHASGPGAPGDATQARAFRDVFEQSIAFDPAAGLTTTGRIVDFAAEFVGFQSNQRAAMDDRARYQSSVAEAIQTQRLNVEGVNIDEELQKLLLFEQSYAASARVMQTAREMMQRLMEI